MKIKFDKNFLWFWISKVFPWVFLIWRSWPFTLLCFTGESGFTDPLEIFQPNFCDHKNYHVALLYCYTSLASVLVTILVNLGSTKRIAPHHLSRLKNYDEHSPVYSWPWTNFSVKLFWSSEAGASVFGHLWLCIFHNGVKSFIY